MLSKTVRLLLIADIIWFFGEGLLGPLFAIFAGRIGGDILEITWAWSAYLIVCGLLILYFGKISDKINKKKLMFYGYLLNAVLTFSYLLVNSPIQLLLVQAGLGVAAAMATPTWDALYSENQNRKKDGLTWGLADGGAQFFSGIAVILGGLIITFFSFNVLFII